MPALKYQIGADNSGLISTLSDSQQRVANFKRQAAVSSGSGSGKFNTFAIGNASNQFADIAVQLEMGTKFARVMGQQLPQLLGGFGPMGALVGGATAVGLGIYSWATNAKEADAASKRYGETLKTIQATAAALTKSTAENTDKLEILTTVKSKQSGVEENQRYLKEIAAIEDLTYTDRAQKTEALKLAAQVHEEKLKLAKEADSKAYAAFIDGLAKQQDAANKAHAKQVDAQQKAIDARIEAEEKSLAAYHERVAKREEERDKERNALTQSAGEVMLKFDPAAPQNVATLAAITNAIEQAKAQGEGIEMEARVQQRLKTPQARKAEREAARARAKAEAGAARDVVREENERRRKAGKARLTEDEENAMKKDIQKGFDDRKNAASAAKILGGIDGKLKSLLDMIAVE